MNYNLHDQVMDKILLSDELNELHPIINILDEAGGQSLSNETISLETMLSPIGLSFGKELTNLESLIGGMELFVLQNDFSNLNVSACSAGCAGNCSGNCFSTCADSCFNRCKSTYNS
jgi:hypothetical protein